MSTRYAILWVHDHRTGYIRMPDGEVATFDSVEQALAILTRAPGYLYQVVQAPQYFYAVLWTLDGVRGLWPQQFGTFETPRAAQEAINDLVPEHRDRYKVVICEVVK